MDEHTSTTFRLVLIKYLVIFLVTVYLLTYLTGKMDGLPTAKETFDFTMHLFARLIELIRMIAGAVAGGE